MPTIRKELWARGLLTLAALAGLGSGFVWWLIDRDVYIALAFSSSFCLVYTEAGGRMIEDWAFGLGALNLLCAVSSYCLRRTRLSLYLLAASIVLQPYWWYAVNLTATTTIPEILR